MMQNTIKCFLFLAASPFLLSGCNTTPTQKPIHPLPQNTRPVLLSPQATTTNPPHTLQLQQPPANYIVWLNQADHKQRVQLYEQYLKEHHANRAVPMYQLLRSARDWQKCGAEPYSVPTPELWSNLLPTLQVIQYLAETGVLREYEVTSVYRDYSLNLCAGGAAGSRHVYNAAVDFRIGVASPTHAEDFVLLEYTKTKLCDFWRNHGQSINMGLGVYASGQIHIDTQGYRTWGADHTRNTSICQ
ncbi:MAG: peptidase M15 [Acinetobacter sp.]|jgi:uncharacterized protein YcbK (DUF882 family)|nr:MAG: peptidase M15 [Acinetobacter sp.]